MNSKLLILDLDETLLHATSQSLARPADFCVASYHIYRRPNLVNFLAFARRRFQVAVWSSSTPLYVKQVLHHILPANYPLVFAWGRDRCTRCLDYELQEIIWIKDLKKVKKQGFPLSSVLMVDDTPQKLSRQYGNLVRVKPFEGDEADDELLMLMTYLDQLSGVDNVRTVEKRGWRQAMEP